MNYPQSFFFYDLETSGLDPKSQRIMQFAGQRTDMDLKPVGEPVNLLVKLTDDILPDPQAILVTGITPQKTVQEGYSEAMFLKILHDTVMTPGTIIVGFNSVRFDDEFMRYSLYRNFYDPYEWQWKDGRSRWDVLDVVRLTRALRPEGIEWPFDAEGRQSNRLEMLTKANKLDHISAHDALSDVNATIAVAKLIYQKQPKLFSYLLDMRDKKKVAALVNLDNPQPFVYTSSNYPKEYLHTSVVFPICASSKPGSVVVYDLRHDPDIWLGKSVSEMKAARFANFEARQKDNFLSLPAQELAFNKCPAVAPLGVLDDKAQARIQLDSKTIQQNLTKLRNSDIANKLRQVFESESFTKSTDVDGQLYDGFVSDSDKAKMSAVRAADDKTLLGFKPSFTDKRLPELLLRYKARNYPKSLDEDERAAWEACRAKLLASSLPNFSRQLQSQDRLTADTDKRYILEELKLWAESILPIAD